MALDGRAKNKKARLSSSFIKASYIVIAYGLSAELEGILNLQPHCQMHPNPRAYSGQTTQPD
jgi:hypothetical protein